MWDWYQDFTDWLNHLLRSITENVMNFFTSVWGVVVIWFGVAYTLVTQVNGWLVQAMTAVDALAFPDSARVDGLGPFADSVAFANTFMPVTELCQMATAFVALLLALQVIKLIKWIKSWLWAA